MIEYPYVVALALIEQEGIRAMPLCGKSIKEAIKSDSDPGSVGEGLTKELLIRVFQRSENAPLRRAAGSHSLLLIQVSMNEMQDKLPILKAEWINSANTNLFIKNLNSLCTGVWSITFTRENGTQLERLLPDQISL